MVTLLITSVLILGIFLIGIYFWQKPQVSQPLNELPPPPSRGLFSEVEPSKAFSDNDLRDSLVTQAAQGDRSTLNKAFNLQNREIYDEVLTVLVNESQSDAHILSLVSHVTRNEWPVNKQLAAAFINSWQKTPDRSSTAKMLHIAALSDDAETFTSAVEIALAFWREVRIPDLPAMELSALLTGEFWVLSNQTRSSGAGFVVKRSLASARRELEKKRTAN